jgi:hypothetical protein
VHRGNQLFTALACPFPQHGPGKKHKRRIELEPWQRIIVSQHPGDFAEAFSILTGADS